jgi:hypothetical protein
VASLNKSLDIFQEKMNEFMFGLVFTRISIDVLLVASEDSFETIRTFGRNDHQIGKHSLISMQQNDIPAPMN